MSRTTLKEVYKKITVYVKTFIQFTVNAYFKQTLKNNETSFEIFLLHID